MVEHEAVDNTTCSCGFTSINYRGLNSHIGNIRRNAQMANERDIAMTNRQINDQAYDIMAQEEWGKSVEQLTDSEYKWIEDVMNDYGDELTSADKPKAGEGGPGSGPQGGSSKVTEDEWRKMSEGERNQALYAKTKMESGGTSIGVKEFDEIIKSDELPFGFGFVGESKAKEYNSTCDNCGHGQDEHWGKEHGEVYTGRCIHTFRHSYSTEMCECESFVGVKFGESLKAKEFKPELQGMKVNIISGEHEGKSGIVGGVEIFGDSIYVNIEGKDVNIEDGDYVLANEGWKPRIQRCNESVDKELVSETEYDPEHEYNEKQWKHNDQGQITDLGDDKEQFDLLMAKLDSDESKKVKGNEVKANESKQVEEFFDIDEYEAKCKLCGEIFYGSDDSPSEQPSLEDHLLVAHQMEDNPDIGGYESYASEDCYEEEWSGLTDVEKDKLEASGVLADDWTVATHEERKKFEDDAELHGEAYDEVESNIMNAPTHEHKYNMVGNCKVCGWSMDQINDGDDRFYSDHPEEYVDYGRALTKEAGLYGYGSATGRMPPAESWNQQYLGGGMSGTGNKMSDSERGLFREFDQLQWSELPADIQELWKSIAEYIPSGEAKANEEIFGYMGLYDKGECKKCGKDYLSHPRKGEGPVNQIGVPFEIDHVFVESSTENWRKVASDLIKEQNKKGKKRSSESYAKEWGYGDLSPQAEELQNIDNGLRNRGITPSDKEIYLKYLLQKLTYPASSIPSDVIGELTDINFHSFVDILQELGAPSGTTPSYESIASEEYSVPSKGTTNGDWLWQHFEWVASMDQDDIECKTCGYQLRPFGVYSIESEIMKEARNHMEGHGLTESKAKERGTDYTRTFDMYNRGDVSNMQKRDLIEQAMIDQGQEPTYDSAFDDDIAKGRKERGMWNEDDEIFNAEYQWEDKIDAYDTPLYKMDNDISQHIQGRLGSIGEAYVTREIWNGIDDIIFRLTLLERAGFNEDVRVGWYTGAETWEELNADNASLISALSSTSITDEEIKDTSSTGYYPELFGEAVDFNDPHNFYDADNDRTMSVSDTLDPYSKDRKDEHDRSPPSPVMMARGEGGPGSGPTSRKDGVITLGNDIDNLDSLNKSLEPENIEKVNNKNEKEYLKTFEAMKFDEDGNLIKSAGSVKPEQDDTALSISEAKLKELNKDGYFFSVIESLDGTGTPFDGRYDVWISQDNMTMGGADARFIDQSTLERLEAEFSESPQGLIDILNSGAY